MSWICQLLRALLVVYVLDVMSTLCLRKKQANCFCHNFLKVPPILIIFGRKMANSLKLCEVHSFCTSLNSCQSTTMQMFEIVT